ncbi:MAG TPA: LptF/LptG family permease, partial [Rhodothermales bacterium]|nr:LptF/LptG family permease [Rhodothermales bacterium]
MTLRALPGPFFGALGTLVFLLVLQFLIRYAKDLIGRGLPSGVVLELIWYNSAYILALAIPIAVFFAVLMAFARLSETQAYAVAQGAGVSPWGVLWPVLALAALVTIGAAHLNNVVLPEANFRARALWQDIRRTQPAFALRPGVFFTRVSGYAIQAQHIPRANRLEDLIVYDLTRGTSSKVVIKAARGQLDPLPGERVALVLEDGSVERDAGTSRAERIRFDRLRFRLDVGGFRFERSPASSYRTDRTTPTTTLMREVDSLRALRREDMARLQAAAQALANVERTNEERGASAQDTLSRSTPPAPRPMVDDPLASLSDSLRTAVVQRAAADAAAKRAEAETAARTLAWNVRETNALRVEIHKKQSIALACLVFALAGAYLGLGVQARRGGLARAGITALFLFLFYWVTLVLGEKLSDRYLWMPPWLGMWLADVVIGVAFVGLFARKMVGR